MSDYHAPHYSIRLALDAAADIDGLAHLDRFSDLNAELVDAILDEAGRFAADVIAPLNRVGDLEGARLENGIVLTPRGFKDAYRQFVEGGWNAVSADPDHGGQGLPYALATATLEMWTSAAMAFSLCPMLNQGAIEALESHGSDEQKRVYLPKLVSGEWTGTMNLTEPQAGSDVGALRTRAEPQPDGTYRISGSKIFITYGDHDMAENIVHLVLARTPDAPAGTRGISLFLVPKFLPGEDGNPGVANDLRPVSLEHKLGIHASPTCVMAYGDQGRCTGYLIGEEMRGMPLMFTMMNNARLNVGLQGVAIAERAYQQAVAYARERRQGRPLRAEAAKDAAIVEHADIRRMLMTMRASKDAARALCYFNAGAIDRARYDAEADGRRHWQAVADLLTPVSKAWSTDIGCAAASLNIQVHGGLGYIEETGAAQHLRDARIAPIYEGTNGIQAMDLVMRKIAMDGGAAARAFLGDLNEMTAAIKAVRDSAISGLAPMLESGTGALDQATSYLVDNARTAPNALAAAASPYLRMFGLVAGGVLLAKAARLAAERAGEGGDREAQSAIATAGYFARNLLPEATALLGAVTAGPDLLYAVDADMLVG